MIIVDTETTGVDPNKNSLVSIGAVDFDNPSDTFYRECRVWNGAHIEDEALKINGFSREEVTDPTKETDEEIVKNFFEWLKTKKDQTLVGENPSFDSDFLKATAYRYHLDYKIAKRTIDLHTVSFTTMLRLGLIPPSKNSHSDLNLEKTLNFCGIPGYSLPHNALKDAKLEAEALSRLVFGRKLLKEYEKYDIPFIK